MRKEGTYAEAEENPEVGIERRNGFSKETIKQLLESRHTITDSGKSGILFRIDNEDLSPEDRKMMAELEGDENPEGSLSIKALKIFDASKAQHEFISLQKAGDIMREYEESSSLPHARIPRGIGYDEVIVDRQTQDLLNANGASIIDGKAGILTMDWIEGKDLSAVLHEELIKRTPEGQDPYRGKIWDNHNFDQLLQALEKVGYVFPEALLTQLKNTVQVLHKKNFYHNDIHLRNLILKKDQLYLIDFADTSYERKNIEEAEGEYFLSDEKLIKGLEPLTKTLEAKMKEHDKKIMKEWDERVDSVRKQPKAVEQYDSLKNALKTDDATMVENQLAASSGSDKDFENFMGNLLRLSREDASYRDQIRQFLSSRMNNKNIKTKNYYILNRMQSLQKAIEQ